MEYINPILLKEMKVGARTIRYPVLIMLYNLLLAFVGLMILFQMNSIYIVSGQLQGNFLIDIFVMAGWIQFLAVCVLMPILTANAIAGERERQTLNMLLTTTMSSRQIVKGKIFACVGVVMIFLLSGMPVISLGLLYGGIRWYHLFAMQITLFVVSLFLGALGILCSVCMKRTISSVILNYVLELVGMAGGYCLWYVLNHWTAELPEKAEKWKLGLEMILLTGNPATVFEQYMESCYSGFANEKYYLLNNLAGSGQTGCIAYIKYRMVLVGLLVFLILAYVFYRMASKQLNPLNHKH